MNDASAGRALPSWADQMRALEGVGDALIAKWGRPDVDEAQRQDMYRLALAMVAEGYLCHVHTNPVRPMWAPLWNIALNQGGPVPDYAYLSTDVDPDGVYRISGYRGTSRFIDISQQSFEMMIDLAQVKAAPKSPQHDLDDLTIGEDGSFEVILSKQRPDGHEGDWWEMDEHTVRLMMRKCSCDWHGEVDARVAIDRLDIGHRDQLEITPQESARRFSDLAAWVEGTITFDMELVKYYREHHPTNGIERSKMSGKGTGTALENQVYYDGIYEIDDDEALIVETDLPRQCRYWQILVADDRFCTVDWVNRQSSLNDFQARVDADGRFRAVISAKDPGVPNWLDKADNVWGIIQLRWNVASDHPDPTVTKVRFDEVRDHLPADTPVVTPEERAAQLLHRRQGAQLRHLW